MSTIEIQYGQPPQISPLPTEPHPLYTVRNLTIPTYGHGYTGWHYRCESDDELRAAIEAPYFFSHGPKTMKPGDTIMVTGNRGGALLVVVEPTFPSRARISTRVIGSSI